MDNSIKVGTIIPQIKLANPKWNAKELIKEMKKAALNQIDVLITPALSLTGVSCGDLFFHDLLWKKGIEDFKEVMDETRELSMIAMIGLPVPYEGNFYNCMAVIGNGKILGVIPKKKLTYEEKRWFTCGKHFPTKIELFGQEVNTSSNTFLYQNHSFKVILEDDIWNITDTKEYQADVIVHISSNYGLVGREEKVVDTIQKISMECHNTYVYVSPGTSESSSNVIYSGLGFICQNGKIEERTIPYSFESSFISAIINDESEKNPNSESSITLLSEEEKQKIKVGQKYPFIPQNKEALEKRCEEIIKMQATALLRRLNQIGSYKTVLGLSGGSDSTLAFLAIIEAYKIAGVSNSNLISITMPGFGTTNRTYENACALAKSYGTTLREINIKEACIKHYQDIGLYEGDKGITYENAQARERTQILMDVANMENALVVGTGDLSELALGWCTYNGDHMSMYSINSGIPKTIIKEIIKYKAEKDNNHALRDIAETPISPELLPPDENGEIKQKTESSIGPYVLHDYFIYHFLRYHSSPREILNNAINTFSDEFEAEEIKKWLNVFLSRFFTQQFKRNCVPDGPKIGSISLCPRGDLLFPSDADKSLWMNELN